jgi:RNA polymerase sigma-70 factor (ECF subfamily)
MGASSPASQDDRSAFLAFYDDALPHVYGYLSARCGNRDLAEDLTAETFLAAVDAVRKGGSPPMSRAWVLGVARHKLVDHWRRLARDERRFELLAGSAQLAGTGQDAGESWDLRLDALVVRRCLDQLAAQHRAALTLRYLDDLPVTEVASLLGRSLHATEALLVRARVAFRRAYAGEEGPDA